MILLNKRNLIFLLVIAMIAGCKAYQPVVMPGVKNVPSTFITTQKDSAGMGAIPWRRFFTDSLLVSLIDTALVNNQDLQVAWQRMEAARARLLKARGAFYPSVNAAVSTGVDKFGDYTMTGVGNFDTNLSQNINDKQKVTQPLVQDFFVGARSSWEIDVWGKLKNAKAASAARVLSSAKGRQFMITSLVSDIASAYYSLLALDNQLRIIQRNIKYQQDALEIVQVMLQAGRGTSLAVQQFKAQLYNTQSYEFTTRQQVVDIESRINILLGRYPQPVPRDSNTLSKTIPARVEAGIPSAMISRRPDVQEAELELTAARLDVASAKAAAMPSLTLTPYLGVNAFKGSLLFTAASLTYGIIGGVTAPLINRKENLGNYQLTGAAQKEAFHRYQQSLLNSFREVYVGLNEIDNKQKIEKLKELEVTELQQAVSTANDLYVAGYASYLEVITAQKSVLQAEFELNDTRKNVWVALVQLYRALGGGWE